MFPLFQPRFGVFVLFLALLMVITLPLQAAPPDGYTRLKTHKTHVRLEGKRIPVTYTPWFRLEMLTGQARIHIHAEGDMEKLRRAVLRELPRLNKNEECGKRITLTNPVLTPDEPGFQVEADVDFQQWKCIKHLGKVKLVDEQARLCARILPEIIDGGKRLKFRGEVACARPDGILGALADSLGLTSLISVKIEEKLNRLLDKKGHLPGFPKEIRSYDPVVRDLAFHQRDDGRLGLWIQGDVTVSQDQANALIGQLLNR